MQQHRYIPSREALNVTVSPTDRAAIIAMVTADPTMWPSKLSEMWGIPLERATAYINKANEAYKAKSLL